MSRRELMDFELLYLVETEPGLSQREIARRLDVSLGRVNYCLRALLEKGALKLANFKDSDEKPRYVYVLTPKGLAQRVNLTAHFLRRKLEEYERLRSQIQALQRESNPMDFPKRLVNKS